MAQRARRERGTGSVYQVKGSRIWWLSYRHPDGTRKSESSGSPNIGVAQALLRKRVGARDHGLPVIPNAEKTTWADGVQAVIDDFTNTGKKSNRRSQASVQAAPHAVLWRTAPRRHHADRRPRLHDE